MTLKGHWPSENIEDVGLASDRVGIMSSRLRDMMTYRD